MNHHFGGKKIFQQKKSTRGRSMVTTTIFRKVVIVDLPKCASLRRGLNEGPLCSPAFTLLARSDIFDTFSASGREGPRDPEGRLVPKRPGSSEPSWVKWIFFLRRTCPECRRRKGDL